MWDSIKTDEPAGAKAEDKEEDLDVPPSLREKWRSRRRNKDKE